MLSTVEARVQRQRQIAPRDCGHAGRLRVAEFVQLRLALGRGRGKSSSAHDADGSCQEQQPHARARAQRWRKPHSDGEVCRGWNGSVAGSGTLSWAFVCFAPAPVTIRGSGWMRDTSTKACYPLDVLPLAR